MTTSTTGDGRRTLCAAQGVLAVLRHCSLDDAFGDLVRTAKHHNVAPLRLAEAILAAAQNGTCSGIDRSAAAAVDVTWGELLRGA